jgi:hypothetical protein
MWEKWSGRATKRRSDEGEQGRGAELMVRQGAPYMSAGGESMVARHAWFGAGDGI